MKTAPSPISRQSSTINLPERVGVAAWSNEDLVVWGEELGIAGDSWQQCVNDDIFEEWVQQVAASQVDAGVTGTPTVFVDGEPFSLEEDLTPVLRSWAMTGFSIPSPERGSLVPRLDPAARLRLVHHRRDRVGDIHRRSPMARARW